MCMCVFIIFICEHFHGIISMFCSPILFLLKEMNEVKSAWTCGIYLNHRSLVIYSKVNFTHPLILYQISLTAVKEDKYYNSLKGIMAAIGLLGSSSVLAPDFLNKYVRGWYPLWYIDDWSLMHILWGVLIV